MIKYKNILNKLKLSLKVFVFDYDNTIVDKNFKLDKALGLFKKIVEKEKYLIIITARGATAIKILSNPLLKLSLNKPIYLGCGNGTILYELSKNKIKTIYNNGLNFSEIKEIIKKWENAYSSLKIEKTDLNIKGLHTLNKFLTDKWKGLIQDRIIDLCKKYNGSCFAEKAKVSIVLPKDKNSHEEIIKTLMSKINDKGKKYLVSKGNDIYCHITRSFNIDPKLYAVQTIMKNLRLKSEEVFVCGDMPLDNDKGLLIDSHLPFAFTNKLIPNWNKDKPPFVLPGSKKSPVGSVHKAVDYLLS